MTASPQEILSPSPFVEQAPKFWVVLSGCEPGDEDISLVSTYWASDDTGAKDDSELFLQTATQLQSNETQVQTLLHVLQDEVQDEEDVVRVAYLFVVLHTD